MSSWYHARFYFVLFGVLGLVSPYLAWWLNSVLADGHLKYAMAVFYFTLILVPAIWGHVAFSGTSPGRWLSNGVLAAVLFSLGLTQIDAGTNIGAACFIILAFGVFFNPIMPLTDALAYNQYADEASYSRIRLFGSLGFTFVSTLIGGVIVMSHPHFFPYMVCLLMLVTWILSLPYKAHFKSPSPSPPSSHPTPKLNILSQILAPTTTNSVVNSIKSLWPLWVVVALSQVAFSSYFAFFALHMKSIGFSGWLIGVLIGIAAAAEVLAFLKMKWFFKIMSPWMLLALASLSSLLRWVVIAFAAPSWAPLLLLMQASQAIGFSVLHTASLKIIHDTLPSTHMGAAQGFYNAVGYGVGGLIGVFVAGVIWENQGSGVGVFIFASTVSFLTLLFSLIVYFKNKSNKSLKSMEANNV